MTIRRSMLALCLVAAAATTFAANPNAGKAVFRQQCALCHSAESGDNGGAQGPNLSGVIGRAAASNSSFGYTQALKASHLTWDAATLERFLTSPTTVVPGSAMVIAVPNATDRDNLIAYFTALKDGTFKDTGPPRGFGPPPGARPPAPPATGTADWKLDAPGRVHRISVSTLPAPFTTPSAANFPRVVPKPEGAKLSVPPGFQVNVFASNLQAPRTMRVAPNGDIFLAETQTGKILVLRASADGSTAASTETFAQGLNLPFGMAFYPSGPNPQWLYVAETNRVVRYAYKVGDQKASGVPEFVVPQLSPTAGGGHFTRDLVFSPDGKRFFVSVGSASNVAEDMPKKSPAEVKTWETEHGFGAAWGGEANRADVLVFETGSNKPGRVFASGLRNCVGLTIQPGTGSLWCTVNERDMLGDDLVPDYSTSVREGAFYGWPWYYMGKYEDPRLKGDRPDLAGKATVPDVPYQAHSAALNLVFYTATSGSAVFPKEYVGDGFTAMHGSWNRAFRTGHKIVRVRMKNGVPTGEYDDFLVGFIADDGNAWGRPVGLTVAPDGALLLSEDGNNTIYRIAYTH
ncbi:MAG TPA: PQQ-dependent sugar dehydrogenase [Steroidobacteraceae bacterium]|nr:PQQ-dependent sugar dehydrogenase [Steroidobacteraceae bacterium]